MAQLYRQRQAAFACAPSSPRHAVCAQVDSAHIAPCSDLKSRRTEFASESTGTGCAGVATVLRVRAGAGREEPASQAGQSHAYTDAALNSHTTTAASARHLIFGDLDVI
jgi:hypothetical protein